MKVKHVFGGHIYLISSFGVARNPLFIDDEDVSFFKDNMVKYLNDICDIFAYCHLRNEFQYLVKIKERLDLEKHFYTKQSLQKENVSHDLFGKNLKHPPESYLIFSQEVSNCLNSYAKRFNFKHKRKGGLFGDRYTKQLIESEEEMEMWIKKLNAMEKLVVFSEEWQIPEQVELSNADGACSSKVFYDGVEVGISCIFENFVPWVKSNMRGCFECLPPHSVKASDFLEKFLHFKKIRGYPPPW